jgi:hypothetical protein
VQIWQALVLVLSFPAMGLLLFVLTVVEERLSGEPSRPVPRQSAGPARERRPPERHRLILWPPDHERRRGAPGGGQRRHAAAGGRLDRKAS